MFSARNAEKNGEFVCQLAGTRSLATSRDFFLVMSGLNGNLEVIEAALLGALKDGEIASTYEWAGEAGFDHGAVENVIKSLRSDEYIEFSAAPLLSWVVTEAGNTVLSSGSPEYNVLLSVIERAAAGDPVGMKDKVCTPTNPV